MGPRNAMLLGGHAVSLIDVIVKQLLYSISKPDRLQCKIVIISSPLGCFFSKLGNFLCPEELDSYAIRSTG
jgi:hypothetical protein